MGMGKNKRSLGRIEIRNTGKGTKTKGDYKVDFISKNGKCFRKTEVTGYARKADPVWKLVDMVIDSYYKREIGEQDEQDN